jgi:hypothetical protein
VRSVRNTEHSLFVLSVLTRFLECGALYQVLGGKNKWIIFVNFTQHPSPSFPNRNQVQTWEHPPAPCSSMCAHHGLAIGDLVESTETGEGVEPPPLGSRPPPVDGAVRRENCPTPRLENRLTHLTSKINALCHEPIPILLKCHFTLTVKWERCPNWGAFASFSP